MNKNTYKLIAIIAAYVICIFGCHLSKTIPEKMGCIGLEMRYLPGILSLMDKIFFIQIKINLLWKN